MGTVPSQYVLSLTPHRCRDAGVIHISFLLRMLLNAFGLQSSV